MRWTKFYIECRYCKSFQKTKLSMEHWFENQDKCVCAKIERAKWKN